MRTLVIIWLILVAILFCLKVQVRVTTPVAVAQVATPTATPTPGALPMCTITGNVVNADGSPFINGTINFNSIKLQVINSIPVPPTNVTTGTDTGGHIRAVALPQGIAMQITLCPGAQGGQTTGCAAPFSAFIPYGVAADFGNLAQGTQLTGTGNVTMSTISATSLFTAPDGSTWNTGGLTMTKNLTLSPTSQFTFPDGTFWTSAGANTVKAIGIGAAAPTGGGIFQAEHDYNGNTTMLLKNTDPGANAATTFYLNNDKSAPNPAGSYGAVEFLSSGYTASGPNELPDSLNLLSGGAGGIEIVSATNSSVKFGSNSYIQANVSQNGLYVGDAALTTNATDPITVTKNQNAATAVSVHNPSTGASAQAGLWAYNDVGTAAGFAVTGHSSSFGGPYLPDQTYVNGGGAGGINLVAYAGGGSPPINFYNSGAITGRFSYGLANDSFQGLELAGYASPTGNGSGEGVMIGNGYIGTNNWANINFSGAAYWNNTTGQWIADGGGGGGNSLYAINSNAFYWYLNGPQQSGNINFTLEMQVDVNGLDLIHAQNNLNYPAITATNGTVWGNSRDSFGYIFVNAWPVTLHFARAFANNAACVETPLGFTGMMWNSANSTVQVQVNCYQQPGGVNCATGGYFSYFCFGIG